MNYKKKSPGKYHSCREICFSIIALLKLSLSTALLSGQSQTNKKSNLHRKIPKTH